MREFLAMTEKKVLRVKGKGFIRGKRFPLYRGMLSPSVVFVFLYFFIFIFLGDHRGFPPILRKTLFLSQLFVLGYFVW